MHIVTVLCVAFVALGAPFTHSAATTANDGQYQWSHFQRQHRKSYASPIEASFRQKIFADNLRYINAHNAAYDRGQTTFRMAINHLSDQLTHEVVAARNGYRPSNAASDDQNTVVFGSLPGPHPHPYGFNWTVRGAVTPVKDQGECGSSWAFSATGALEGQQFLKSGKLVSLSEQNLVDCAHVLNHGCDGGDMVAAFEYVKKNGGIDTEESYPYRAKNDKCYYDPSHSGATDSGMKRLRNNETELALGVINIGPIAVAIDASHRSFQMYNSGVYYEPKCSSSNLDHGVLLVGYGLDEETNVDYWLVKNSWGTQWGDNGYIKMARFRNNNCGIATDASFPLV